VRGSKSIVSEFKKVQLFALERPVFNPLITAYSGRIGGKKTAKALWREPSRSCINPGLGYVSREGAAIENRFARDTRP
jgi:hypothetical protein